MAARGKLAALLLPLALLAGACGDDTGSAAAQTPADPTSTAPSVDETTDPSGSPTDEPAPEPQCSEIWVEGNKLPGGYDGCYDGDRRVKPNSLYCAFGKPLVTYQAHWYATPGGPVNHTEGPLAKDADFQKALRACGG